MERSLEEGGGHNKIEGDQIFKERQGKGMICTHQYEQYQVCRECLSPPDIQSNPYSSNYLLRLKTAMSSNGMRSTARSAIAVGVFCRAPMEQPPPPPVEEGGGSSGVVTEIVLE